MDFYDFPETVGNVIIPTDEVICFRGIGSNHQPVDVPQIAIFMGDDFLKGSEDTHPQGVPSGCQGHASPMSPSCKPSPVLQPQQCFLPIH